MTKSKPLASNIFCYLEADVRRNERKMGGFASWEIFGTGFEIRIFLQFSCGVQVSKFQIFLRFPAIFRGHKKISKCWFFRSVSGFWRTGLSKNSLRFSRNEQGLKFGSSRGVLQFLGDPKNSWNAVIPAVSRDFEGRARPNFFATRTSPQFSLDFEGSDPPKKIVN